MLKSDKSHSVRKILKFGGSSVATAERIQHVLELIQKSLQENGSIAVVFSAFGGVTDHLIQTAQLACRHDDRYLDQLEKLEERHLNILKTLVPAKELKSDHPLQLDMQELREILHGVYWVRDLTPRTLDFVQSFGERLSVTIITRAAQSRGLAARMLDSRQVVKTDAVFGNASVLWDETIPLIKNYFSSAQGLQIITGFIGSTMLNETTTLGRGGSDYSASLFGAALDVAEIEIWTDVDGVMTANPAKVKKAFPLEQITYEEAMELSHFGAKVIYPPTMQPAMQKRIPIRIKNTFNPEFPGTLIGDQSAGNRFLVKGISSISDIALLRIQGSGMVGVSGIAGRLFAALARHSINIILITQASSEHSICIAVEPKVAELSKEIIEKEFELELQVRRIDPVVVEKGLSIIAAVGEKMHHVAGLSGRLFQALGVNGINIVAIAQGSSELNISVVIDQSDESKALNAIHEAFFLSATKTLHLFVAGTGLIGSTLLRQLKENMPFLRKQRRIDIKLVGIANEAKMYFDEKAISLERWGSLLEEAGEATVLSRFIDRMLALNLPNSIFLDCTASDEPAQHYVRILRSNVSVVTPNKRANSGSYADYERLHSATVDRGSHFYYETNVGAGLPIINTMNDLIASGDKIIKIEAVLSGTLSYVFNSFDGTTPFSQVIAEARSLGYTEPDPRIDLSGLDVARKILILAREAGLQMELADIELESLLPDPCRQAATVEDFFETLKSFDADMETRRSRAGHQGKVLRYMATLQNNRARVTLQAVDINHPFYFLSGTDNVVSFTTSRYKDRPLIVRGPGAGAEVTAAGVFADVLRAGYGG
jgi:aspartokinase/homoserine dehydrogenase 1